MSSDNVQCKKAQALLQCSVEAENTPFIFLLKQGGEEFWMAPLVYVDNLQSLVVSLLQETNQ